MTTANPGIAEFTRLPGDRHPEVTAWQHVARLIRFTPASWMSASILSFCVAAAATLLVGFLPLPGRRGTGAARQAPGQPAR